MRVLTILSALFIYISLEAQVFVSPGGIVEIKNGALITVQNMDVENQGDISHAGNMEVSGNIINSGQWICDPSIVSRIALNLNWTNNLTFSPGIGRVEFNGANQTIGGNIETYFYNLDFKGISGITKTLLNSASCLDSLYLNDIEVVTNGNIFSLRNGVIPVQRKTGYISTFSNGLVRVLFPSAISGNREIPLGFGAGPTNYKPVFMVNPASDSFDMILFGNSPDLNGRNSTSLQDSLCSINNNYYYMIKTYGNDLFYGVSRNNTELQYTKLANWNGTAWDKISGSGPTSAISLQNLAYNSQKSSLTEFVSQAREKPFVDAGPDIVLFPGTKTRLNPSGYFPAGFTFLWDPGEDLSCIDCPDPLFTMGKAGIYTIRVSNGPNCEAIDSLRINLIGEYKDLVANAFSPNGDNLNDDFGPILFPGDKLLNLEIYNRWGELLYKGTKNWDGYYQGKPVIEGVYIYKISIKGLSETRFYNFSGNVTLLR